MKRRDFLISSLSSSISLLAATACAKHINKATSSFNATGLPVPALPSNGMIGVIAPASPCLNVNADISEWLASRGYRSFIFPTVQKNKLYLAGSDNDRLHDLHAAFANKDIDAIICLRGGYGSARFLDKIDFELIHNNPKPFVGYSDITALHIAIARYANLVTFHGPMFTSDLLHLEEEITEPALFDMLQGRITGNTWLNHPAAFPLVTVIPGIARGKLIGGNLSIICSLLGTPYEIDTKNSILFIEEVNEPLYRIDRLLTQLRLAGKFESLRGVLVGDFSKLPLNDLIPLLKQEFGHLNIPILAGWRSGHVHPNLTLPLNAIVTLNTQQPGIKLEQTIVTQKIY